MTSLHLILPYCVQSEYSSIEKHSVIIVDRGCLVKRILQKGTSQFCEALYFDNFLLVDIYVWGFYSIWRLRSKIQSVDILKRSSIIWLCNKKFEGSYNNLSLAIMTEFNKGLYLCVDVLTLC